LVDAQSERRQSLDIREAIRERKSIRGYKPDMVPKDILRDVLNLALRAPSAMNIQPWKITVITGEVLDNIKRSNVEMLASGRIPNPDIPIGPFKDVYRQRQVDLAIQIFKLMGIDREDSEKRVQWMQRGFRFFDAPAAIILSSDKSLGESCLFDIGTICQTICLAALAYGLGTCIEDQGIMFPQVVRKFTSIPDSERIIIGIAIGYPDWDFPANELETEREPVENIARWYGFD
jgi:nitroreductase